MTEEQFSNLFIRPLYNDKFLLSEISKNIYDEILDLSNKFCMPSQVLNNLIYNPKIKNPLIDGLKKQIYISNLKKLINQRELLKISKLFNENEIEYVFLKGSAINSLCDDYVRYARDLDVLVSKKSLKKAYKLLKNIGYRYFDPLVSDNANFINNKHHLPVLSNGKGGLVEIHHRVTKKSIYKECPLTDLMLAQYSTVNKNRIDIKISSSNHLVAHVIYHAAFHHKFNIGPVFLYDIKNLKNKITNNKELENLLHHMNLVDVYKDIKYFLENRNTIDSFKTYEIFKNKILNETTPKIFKYFFFSKKGFKDLLNKILGKFKYNEDIFQTSKYSFKFYIILFIQLKNYISKILKK